MKKGVIIFGILLLILLVACSKSAILADAPSEEVMNTAETDSVKTMTDDTPEVTPSADWRNTIFTDVNSGQTFKISDFAGQKVLIETFAVWCPTCTAQQKILKDFAEEGDDSVHISLDTDPNEDEEKVKAHTERNSFDWRYAVSPADTTRLLIDEFGVGVINAPRAPIILICEDQSARLMKSGLKRISDLEGEIAKGC